MTTYGAYDMGLPCKNPSCKSHGVPHPNCRCYGSFAEGGEVSHFCSEKRDHVPTCEYFAGGGIVPSHEDHAHSVTCYLGESGLHGLLRMGQDVSEKSVHHYNRSVKRGHLGLHARLGHIFNEEKAKQLKKEDLSEHKKKIHDWIENGGVNSEIIKELYSQNETQNFAEGGEVKKSEGLAHDHHISRAYPDQHVTLQTVKGRASNYLSSLKPQKNQPKLAFDGEPDTREKQKSYDKALTIAAHPFHMLEKIKDGSIDVEHLQHFKSMYPELDGVLQKKLTEEITKAQLAGKKPSYHARQGLSVYMGVPLGAELTPQNIQAAQAVFQNTKGQPQEQGQPVTKNKKNTSTLTKASQSFLTGSQARIERQQKI